MSCPCQTGSPSLPLLAQLLDTTRRRWARVRGLAAGRWTNADLHYFKVPLELLLPFSRRAIRRKKVGSKDSSCRGWRNGKLGEKKTFPERLSPTVSPTLVAPESFPSPETFSYSQLPTCISPTDLISYLHSQTSLMSEVWSDPASSKILPPVFSLLLL